MPPLQIPRSMSSWRRKPTITQSGCLPIRFFNRRSDICSSALLVVLRARCDEPTPASAIRRKAGRHRAAWWPKSSGTLASFIPALASSSPTCRDRPSGSSPSITSAGRASSGSRKARTPSSGRGCHAARLPPTPCGFSFMRWPIISPTSCGHWLCRRRSSSGR